MGSQGKKLQFQQTSQKVKVIGREEYVNTSTGEVEEFQVLRIDDADANFSKIWLGHVLAAVDQIGNAKMRVLMHVISRRNPSTNTLIATTQEIAEAVGVSKKTVIETLKALETADVVRRKSGVVMLNPDVVFKGPRGGRLKVLLDYGQWKQEELQLDEPAQSQSAA